MRRFADRGLFALLSIGVGLPVLLLVMRALSTTWFYPTIFPHSGRGQAFGLLFAEQRIWRAFGASIVLAALTGLVGTALAFAVGRTLARSSSRVRQFAAAAAFLPVIAPPIALGVGVQVVALQAHLAGGMQGVLLAHLIPAVGYLTLYFLGVLSVYDASMEDEARTLGASNWQLFARVTFPALRPRIAEAMVLGALVSWGQLALTLLVGGGAVRTLPVELLSYVRAGDDRLGAAAAILLTLPPALAIGLLSLGTRRTGAVA